MLIIKIMRGLPDVLWGEVGYKEAWVRIVRIKRIHKLIYVVRDVTP